MVELLFLITLISAILVYLRYRSIADHQSLKAQRLRRVFWALVGFLVAPAISAMIIALGAGDTSPVGVLLFLAICYGFSFAAAIVFGAPSYLVLDYFGYVKWWSSIIIGFAIGVLVEVILKMDVFLSYLPFRTLFDESIGRLITYGVIGAISAFVFWLIWRRGQNKRGLG